MAPSRLNWLSCVQIPYFAAQLGFERVYLSFNSAGGHSTGLYYQIASWAVEPFSSTRGSGDRCRIKPTLSLAAKERTLWTLGKKSSGCFHPHLGIRHGDIWWKYCQPDSFELESVGGHGIDRHSCRCGNCVRRATLRSGNFSRN